MFILESGYLNLNLFWHFNLKKNQLILAPQCSELWFFCFMLYMKPINPLLFLRVQLD